MTKTTLKWRLSELPTGGDVADLIAQGVITKEEAREILFNEESEDTNKVAALKEEVKFLRELVDKLAAKHNGWTTIYHEYHDYRPRYPVWYGTYGGLMQTYANSSSNLLNAVYTTTNGTNMSTTGSIGGPKGLSSLN